MNNKIFYSAVFTAEILAVSQWEPETNRTNALPFLPCQLSFSAIGVSVDVPIWVPQPSVDLRICLYERLYQDSVEVRSRWAALGLAPALALQGHLLKALWALEIGLGHPAIPDPQHQPELWSIHAPSHSCQIPCVVPVLWESCEAPRE